MKELDPREGAYRAPDRDRAKEQELLVAFDVAIAQQRARDRHRVRRARLVGLIVSGVCALLFALAMAENLVKEGVTGNGLRPLLGCAAVVLGIALLVRRARRVLQNRGEAARQRLEADVTERVAAEVRAAREARAAQAAEVRAAQAVEPASSLDAAPAPAHAASSLEPPAAQESSPPAPRESGLPR